ncbi:MAG TPA: polyprenyl diphosphate synthase [Steroidobacteraceae bacterium]|nr:polyprenyl diphosphate synthase [Steroidobacteraceae bacterium]
MTQSPDAAPRDVPRHVAVIMDGNGRWAQQRGSPRTAGHRAGTEATRAAVEHSLRRGVKLLTLFAFSSENWARPAEEVGVLMQMFIRALQREVKQLVANGVRLRFIGDRSQLTPKLREGMLAAESRTAGNDSLELFVAMSYGGRWDLLQAARRLAEDAAGGRIDPAAIGEEDLASRLALSGVPDPDLFIRTGGEQRISNFLLWNLAYTELYFCDTLWPDFGPADYDLAIDWYGRRERRYGKTSQQVGSS